MSTGSGGGPPHDAGVRRTGHPEGSAGEGRYADGVFPARCPAKPGRKKGPAAASGGGFGEVLKALDQRQAGKSRREVAVALWGAKVVVQRLCGVYRRVAANSGAGAGGQR